MMKCIVRTPRRILIALPQRSLCSPTSDRVPLLQRPASFPRSLSFPARSGSILARVAATVLRTPFIRPVTAVAHAVVDSGRHDGGRGVAGVWAVEAILGARAGSGLVAPPWTVAKVVVHRRDGHSGLLVKAQNINGREPTGAGRGDPTGQRLPACRDPRLAVGAIISLPVDASDGGPRHHMPLRWLCSQRHLLNLFVGIDHVHSVMSSRVHNLGPLHIVTEKLVLCEQEHQEQEDRANAEHSCPQSPPPSACIVLPRLPPSSPLVEVVVISEPRQHSDSARGAQPAPTATPQWHGSGRASKAK
eukprot:m.76630 g.76630  ORF g.76630 m.76630 type:complete len:303 (+) comp19046_c0_seq6:1874-2782(+)